MPVVHIRVRCGCGPTKIAWCCSFNPFYYDKLYICIVIRVVMTVRSTVHQVRESGICWDQSTYLGNETYIYVHVYIFNEFNPKKISSTKGPNEIQRYSKNKFMIVCGSKRRWCRCNPTQLEDVLGGRATPVPHFSRWSESELDCAETDLVTAAARATPFKLLTLAGFMSKK